MRLVSIRRHLHYFSTFAIVSCCYVMLHKTSSKNDADRSQPEQQLVDVKHEVPFQSEVQVLPYPRPATNLEVQQPVTDIVIEKIDRIVNLPEMGAPSTDPNRTLNWLDLWSNDTFCNQFSVHLLEENSVQPRALVSFPGSGNTWLRMLLMGVTGLYVDTIYPGDELFISKAGSTYELNKDCNCSLLQKTHDLSLFSVIYNMAIANKSTEQRIHQEVDQFRGDGILVIRNPFKAILSYRNFAFGGNMAGLAPVEAFSQGLEPVRIGNRKISTWDQFVSRCVASWEMLATVWIRGLKRGGVVYYEKLRRDTGPQLLRMAEMLGIPNVNKDRLDCVLRHNQDNTFKRSESGPKNYPKNPFTESQHLLILKSIESVQLALKERGLDPLPVEMYDFYTPMYQYGHSIGSSL
ncbi:sialate:O-sulfotransferase 2-like [Daphnia carinata]|uniref:sialate:O-sulfotransferase 2-like n=1 Tax=Daphnia carinata TaxID=120202 RepID=UPI00257BDA01|nr:sialate:O-sulfotransferase 2-like [Daphnia carinata]